MLNLNSDPEKPHSYHQQLYNFQEMVRSIVLVTDHIEIKSSCLREVLGFSFLQCLSFIPLDATLLSSAR